MTTLTDPYAAKYRRRFAALLFAVVLLLLGLVLRSSADGAPLVSVTSQPFWSTLPVFQTKPNVSLSCSPQPALRFAVLLPATADATLSGCPPIFLSRIPPSENFLINWLDPSDSS